MKKYLLCLGTTITIIAPLTAIVSCGVRWDATITGSTTTTKTQAEFKIGLSKFKEGKDKTLKEFSKLLGITIKEDQSDKEMVDASKNADTAIIDEIEIIYPLKGEKIGHIKYVSTNDDKEGSVLTLKCMGKLIFP